MVRRRPDTGLVQKSAPHAGAPAHAAVGPSGPSSLNAALRAAAEHQASRTAEPDGSAATRAGLAAALRAALALAAAGLG
ncbi:hypothetical protein [Streptomyces sp. NPDC048224]|uniref:hypothetical protein n=1 Tax=Streptomyces sp. NPDC048224 TaxID=3154500 RepID=UPI00340D96CF